MRGLLYTWGGTRVPPQAFCAAGARLLPDSEKEVLEVKKITAMLLVALVAFAGVAALAGCGNSQTQAKTNLSTDINDLTSSMTELVDPNTYQSIDTFKTTWNKITTQYNKTVADAKKVKNVQVSNLSKSYDALKKAIGNVSSSQSLQAKISGILLTGESFLAAINNLNAAVTPSK